MASLLARQSRPPGLYSCTTASCWSPLLQCNRQSLKQEARALVPIAMVTSCCPDHSLDNSKPSLHQALWWPHKPMSQSIFFYMNWPAGMFKYDWIDQPINSICSRKHDVWEIMTFEKREKTWRSEKHDVRESWRLRDIIVWDPQYMTFLRNMWRS